jgi:hypothetical protein
VARSPHRALGRLAIRAAAFVSTGAAMAIVIAWACVLLPAPELTDPTTVRYGRLEADGAALGWVRQTRLGHEGIAGTWRSAPTAHGESVEAWLSADRQRHEQFMSQLQLNPDPVTPDWGTIAIEPPRRGQAAESRGQLAFGWPLPCTWYQVLATEPLLRDAYLPVTGIRAPAWFRRLSPLGFQAALPVRPIWPRLLMNTALFASALAILWHAPLGLRSIRRRRRGLCPRCAYDLRAAPTPTCPECGNYTPSLSPVPSP